MRLILSKNELKFLHFFFSKFQKIALLWTKLHFYIEIHLQKKTVQNATKKSKNGTVDF